MTLAGFDRVVGWQGLRLDVRCNGADRDPSRHLDGAAVQANLERNQPKPRGGIACMR